MALKSRDIEEQKREAADIAKEMGFCPICHDQEPCGCCKMLRKDGKPIRHHIDTC